MGEREGKCILLCMGKMQVAYETDSYDGDIHMVIEGLRNSG